MLKGNFECSPLSLFKYHKRQHGSDWDLSLRAEGWEQPAWPYYLASCPSGSLPGSLSPCFAFPPKHVFATFRRLIWVCVFICSFLIYEELLSLHFQAWNFWVQTYHDSLVLFWNAKDLETPFPSDCKGFGVGQIEVLTENWTGLPYCLHAMNLISEI